MNKKDALALIYKCADEYKRNLSGQNLLFIFGSQGNTEFFQAKLQARNFLHLTGVELHAGRFASSNIFLHDALIEKFLLEILASVQMEQLK